MCATGSSTIASRFNRRRMQPRQSNMRRLADERGSNLVEIALVTILIFSMVAAVVDFGGAYQHYIVLLNASREGARMYARLPCQSATRVAVGNAVVQAALDEAAGSNVEIRASDVVLSPNASTACPAVGVPLVVTVNHRYPTMFGEILGFGHIDIRAATSMVYSGNDSYTSP